MSLIMHAGYSLDSGKYYSDVFDKNKKTLWYCDGNETTQTSALP